MIKRLDSPSNLFFCNGSFNSLKSLFTKNSNLSLTKAPQLVTIVCMKKWIIYFSLLIGLLLSPVVNAQEPDIAAQHVFAIEASTGKILYEKNADEKTYIASISKILTIYLVLEDIHNGKLDWDSQVTLSDYAYGLTQDYAISNPDMSQKTYSVQELVNASMVYSANSAAIALAEKVAGSEPAFVDRMRQKLESFGITDYQIVNSTGLNNSVLDGNIYPGSGQDDENMLSAKSVALVAWHLINDYPEILSISSLTSTQLGNETLISSNKMLAKSSEVYREGVDGLKTGTTELAGETFVVTSQENGMRVIAVLLNADNAEVEENARFKETNKLLDYLYQTFEMKTLVSADQKINQNLPVTGGIEKSVTPYASQELKVVSLKDSKVDDQYTISPGKLTAPVSEQEEIANLLYDDQYLIGDGYLFDSPQVSLYTKKSIKETWQSKVSNLFKNLVNKLKSPFNQF